MISSILLLTTLGLIINYTTIVDARRMNFNGPNGDYDTSRSPIIGVLAQELDEDLRKFYPNKKIKSYIAASYVKFVESAGAQVVPIFIGKNVDYYDKITSSVNGILLPGGDSDFDVHGDGYAGAANIIYQQAMLKNLPLWGTCQGFEILAILGAGKNLLADCNAQRVNYPLHFVKDYRNSDLFGKAPRNIINALKTKNVTYNNHKFCLTKQNMSDSGILDEWKILSMNVDEKGFEFVSSMESTIFPFYATQFHPEKNNFEFSGIGYTHTKEAVAVSQYFANFFIDVTRGNLNYFNNQEDELNNLIYNYSPTFTGKQPGFRKSKIFINASNKIIHILQTQNVTYNNHKFCLTENNMSKYHLLDDWKISSISINENGFRFVSTIESKIYPFFAVQYHPEKNNCDFSLNEYVHTKHAIAVSQYFANFFVFTTRNNGNFFHNPWNITDLLIYNYQKTFTGKLGIPSTEMYFFEQ